MSEMTDAISNKKNDSVRDFLARQKLQVIKPVEEPHVMNFSEFLSDSHIELEEIIFKSLAKYGVEWLPLKKGIQRVRDANKNGFWYEEYTAMVCHSLYSNLPSEDRISWIAIFINRSKSNVQALLALHYELYFSIEDYSPVNYCDFYADINFQVSAYFKKYYQCQPDFKYQ